MNNPFFPKREALLALLVCAAVATSGWWSRSEAGALAGRPIVRVYQQEDYRGHQRVHDVVQSSDGFVYASNYGGLREGDGREWRRIEVPTTWIVGLAAGPDGRVYAAVTDDIGYVGLATPDALEKTWVSLRDRLPAGTDGIGQVSSVVWRDGAAWWGGTDRVWRWDGREMREWKFPQTDGAHCILRDGGRELYLHRRGDALYRWSGGEWTVLSREPTLTASTLAAVVDDWETGATLGIDGEAKGWRIGDGGVERWPLAAEKALLGTVINRGDRLSDGRLLLCTQDRGIAILDAAGTLTGQYGDAAGMPSLAALGATEDAERGVWVGTEAGLVRLELFSAVTEIPPPSRAAGIFFRLVRHDGRLYARGDDGIYRLDEDGGAVARWEKVPGLSAMTFDLLSHPRGLLAGTENGLAGVDGSGEVRPLVETGAPVLTLAASRTNPDRVFAGHSDGVTVLRFAAGNWRVEGRIPQLNADARALIEDDTGTLWVGAPGKGLTRVRRPPGRDDWAEAELHSYRPGRELPAKIDYINFAESAAGVVFSCWPYVFNYEETLDRFVPAKAFLQTRFGAMYAAQFSGPPDQLWFQSGDNVGPAASAASAGIGSEIGALRRQRDGSWNWQPLPQHLVRQVDYYGAYSTFWEANGGGAEGVLWVPTARRVLRVDVARARKESYPRPAPVVVRTAQRAGENLLQDSKLPFSRAPLRFTFVSPRHGAGTAVEYRYRLRGNDETWTDWAARTEASYTNLAGGSFRFEVEARDEAGLLAAPASLEFSMAAPWYRQPAAWGLYLLGAAIAVIALFRWRMAAARRERRRLEALVDERTAAWREAKERAEAASRAKTLFLASMSHELRTPLHAILGYAQLLGDDREASPRIRDRLRIVQTSGQHLLRLIGNVLDLSKLDIGAGEIQSDPILLRSWLNDIASGSETRALAKGLIFSVKVDADVPDTFNTDAQKLRQVLDNLLSNAVKFTATGSVTLRLAREESKLRFEVNDTGAGIDREAQARLFRIFGESDPTALGDETGAGLGLAIAHRLVGLLGGELQVASEPGAGTRFWYTLPLRDAAPVPTPAVLSGSIGRVTGYSGRRRSILAVDDVAANRELCRDLLEPLGFEVTLAASAEEALAALVKQPRDLLILDLRLPGMNGLQLARRLRASPQHEGMKILAASASVLGHDPRETFAAGCDAFLPKPFLAEDFLTKVAELLALTWIKERADEFTSSSARDDVLTEKVRAALCAAANDGDIVTLQREVQRLRAEIPRSTLLDTLERLIQSYDLDGIVHLLEIYAASQQRS